MNNADDFSITADTEDFTFDPALGGAWDYSAIILKDKILVK